MEDDEETSEVPDASCSPQSSTIIYCFLSGTHTYIDGTKDVEKMKKRLRFKLPNPPLKVLRGEPEEDDLQDRLFARFQDPGSSSDDDDYDDDTGDIQVVAQVHHVPDSDATSADSLSNDDAAPLLGQ